MPIKAGVNYLRRKFGVMKNNGLIVLIALLLTACGGTGQQHDTTMPSACEMLTLKQLEDILREPVENPIATTANVGERSACTFTLPGRAKDDNLVIYILNSNIRKDPAQFDALVAEWQARNMGAEYQTESVSGYPMAYFPGEHNVYPPTFLISFNQIDLVIQGASRDDAKSIAFRAMVQYQWK